MKLSRPKGQLFIILFLFLAVFAFENTYTLAKNSTKNSAKIVSARASPKEEVLSQELTSGQAPATQIEIPTPTLEPQQPEQADEPTITEERTIITTTVETPAPTQAPAVSTPTPQVVQTTVVQQSAPVVASFGGRASEIFDAMNAYRQARGLPTISKSGTLCSIAQARANENAARGSLSHDGFTNYVHNQGEYTTMSEVLFWADFQASGSYMVNEGWDKSPAHHDAINDPIWRSGCGGVAGNFAAFEFGA